MAAELTQEYVKSLFDYHEDGYLIWKVKKAGNINIGGRAGYLNKQTKGDRYMISIGKKDLKAARIIFLWHHGYMPEIVDHENNITFDDRIKNLRPASLTENNRNKKSSKNSSSKYLGVSFWKNHKKWVATIFGDEKRILLGYFKSEDDAALAYNRAAVKHYKEFANLNIIIPKST